MQQDTFKGDVYSPWTQNLYTYTSNNPVNYIDPTGYSKEQWALAEGMKYAMGEAKKQTNIFAALNTFMTSIPKGYNDALKRADAREKELRKELAGQVGKRNTNKDELARSSYKILMELTLLTDVEVALDGRFIDGAYEWIGYTISDNSATVDCGYQSGPGAITLHSHTYLESGAIAVLDEMHVLHSKKDFDKFGLSSSQVETSYVTALGGLEKFDAVKHKGTNAFKGQMEKIEKGIENPEDNKKFVETLVKIEAVY